MGKQNLYGALLSIGILAIGACSAGLPVGTLIGQDSLAVAPFLPEDITLEISEMPATVPSNAKMGPPEGSAAGPMVRDGAFVATGGVMHAFHKRMKGVLGIGAQIYSDLTDPNQTQVSGDFWIKGQTVRYFADFSAFDIDGDGALDGSGVPGETPVAVRIWVDQGDGWQRFLAALITRRPSHMNAGSGEIFVKPGAALDDAPPSLQIRAMWDRSNDDHRWNEAFINGKIMPHAVMANGHKRIDIHKYDGGIVEKTVRTNTVWTEHPFGLESHALVVHYQKGADAVLFSAMNTGGNPHLNFENLCVSLHDRTLPAEGQCDEFIAEDVDFISAPQGGEADFPADFPEVPPLSPNEITGDDSAT